MSGRMNRLALASAIIAATAALSVGAHGQAERPSRTDCFRADQVDAYSTPGDNKVIVRVSPSRQYELDVIGSCRDLEWGHRIALRARGSGYVCSGLDAELEVLDQPGGSYRCQIGSVRRLSAAEIEAAR